MITSNMENILEILNALKAEFPVEQVEDREGSGGKIFKYVATKHIINRLDTVFPLAWGWQNLDHKIYTVEKSKPIWENKQVTGYKEVTVKQVAVLGRLSLTFPNGFIVSRDAWGGSDFEKGSSTGDPFKIAASNALKKAAWSFGVGLYLTPDRAEKSNKGSYNNYNNKSPYKSNKTAATAPTDTNAPVVNNPFKKS